MAVVSHASCGTAARALPPAPMPAPRVTGRSSAPSHASAARSLPTNRRRPARRVKIAWPARAAGPACPPEPRRAARQPARWASHPGSGAARRQTCCASRCPWRLRRARSCLPRACRRGRPSGIAAGASARSRGRGARSRWRAASSRWQAGLRSGRPSDGRLEKTLGCPPRTRSAPGQRARRWRAAAAARGRSRRCVGWRGRRLGRLESLGPAPRPSGASSRPSTCPPRGRRRFTALT